jgi:hypothetical protein
VGIKKYGTTVAENPLSLREWLQHAYEETLDNAVYLRRAIAEIDKTKPSYPPPYVFYGPASVLKSIALPPYQL